VVFELPQVLFGLLQGMPGVSDFVVKGQALPAADFHCPLLSLPLAFNTTLESIPSPGPYLEPDAGKVEQWSKRLGPKSRPRIGVVWSGNSQHKNDHNRSIPLESLLPQLPEQFDWVSLQREVREADSRVLELHPGVRHFGAELEDFTDTAALCALMDFVISVDTSVAHLSGALGRPTWILLPHLPDWRWLLDREDSPWYASAKLYRQSTAGQWDNVIAQLNTDLFRF
jgi:ADP-heptose:LPS heptosyltransferase